MQQQHRKTAARFEADLLRAIEQASAACGFGWNGNHEHGKVIYDRRDRIAEMIISALRRNWTVVERARSQRTLP